MQLQHVQTLQQNYFYEKSKYTTDLKEIGFIQEKLVVEGDAGKANYRIEIVHGDSKGFLARSTAIVFSAINDNR